MANYTQNDDLINQNFSTGDTITLSFVGEPKEIRLPSGTYKIECWGGKGGNAWATGGSGGYIQGILTLTNSLTAYAYVGGQATGTAGYYASYAGWNGGGTHAGAIDQGASAGGGASDIRLTGGAWNNVASLRSRIIVAGGGGGCRNTQGHGGHGGGLTGNNGTASAYGDSPGRGGTQTAGGTGSRAGSFGIGANGNGAGSPGAGGGYYGGGASYASGGISSGSGGGSSFISGMSGCNAVDINGNHTGQSIHYSGLFFTDCSTASGINNSNGQIIITVIMGIQLLHPYQYFVLKDNIIQDPNVVNNINAVDLIDFSNYGLYGKELSSNERQSFLIATKLNNITTKIVPLNKIIENSNFINISRVENIWGIRIIGQIPINTNLKLLINNESGWFTYKNSQWNKLSNDSLKNSISEKLVENVGMTPLEISLISSDAWSQLFPNEEKIISFLSLMTTEEFDATPTISNIIVDYKSEIYGKNKIHDTLYSYKQKTLEYQITWNTVNKRQIEVIVASKNTD